MHIWINIEGTPYGDTFKYIMKHSHGHMCQICLDLTKHENGSPRLRRDRLNEILIPKLRYPCTSVDTDSSILIDVRVRSSRNNERPALALRVHTAFHAMDLLHFQSLLALRLLLRDPHLFEEHIRTVIHYAGITFPRALFAAEGAELCRLYVARCFAK